MKLRRQFEVEGEYVRFTATNTKLLLFKHCRSVKWKIGGPMPTLVAKMPTFCWRRTIVAVRVPSNNAEKINHLHENFPQM
jgi:hypothetical protein